ncbi:MAG: cell envelope-related function transcriptional attenuator [Microgenomates group bacterium Gr01-1014_16]|nr:MAG: cell envelope-related function transcriptional attenuator [Microgenomates group bacterium Gr01-1014_16]
MPEEKTDKPKVMLDAVVEEPAATVEELVRVPEVTMPVEVIKVEGGNGKWTWVWAIVGLLLGIAVGGGGGYVIWGNKKEIAVVKPAVVAGPTKSPGVTPTLAVEVKRSELKVKVLNGSGVRGEAAKAKELLESLGYPEVVTGNADKDDYEQTEVTVAKDEYWGAVRADLETKYTVSAKPGTADLGGFDVVIILGGV